MRLLSEIEARFEVDQWTIKDVHIWPIMRMDLLSSLYSNDKNLNSKTFGLSFKIHEGINVLFGLGKYVKAYISDRGKNSKPIASDFLFLADGVSRVNLRGKWYDRFCDPLIDYLNKKNLSNFVIEPLHKYLIPRYRSSMFIQPQLDYHLIKRMLFSSKKNPNTNLKGFAKFIEFLKTKNLNIPLPDEKRVQTIFLAIEAYAEVFEKILQKVKPKLGFVVSYYGPIGLAFTLACKKQNVVSIDIQHGLQGPFHPSYGCWSKIPKTGYEFLPSVFLCWSHHEVKTIEKWSRQVSDYHKAIECENLFFSLWLEGSNEIVQYFDKIILKSIEQTATQRNILLTLSNNFDSEDILTPTLIAIKKGGTNWKWWIRLHPISLHKRETIRQMLVRNGIHNFELDISTDLPLYAILRHMDVHMTHFSSTVIEATNFGIPSVVTGKDAIQYFADQIASGMAIYAEKPNDIVLSIQRQLAKKTKPITRKKQVDMNELMRQLMRQQAPI